MRLRRPVHPSDLYQLLAHHAERNYVPQIAPVNDDALIAAPRHARILVADDEPMNRQIVVHALEQFGYTVDIAHNGEEVIRMLDQKHYKIILMDMQMPVLDGLEATRRIRAREDIKKGVPIIAFTASIEMEQRQKYLDNGISAILGKPFSLRELRQTVEAWLAL
jgi:CheY-like chemotaxis protein